MEAERGLGKRLPRLMLHCARLWRISLAGMEELAVEVVTSCQDVDGNIGRLEESWRKFERSKSERHDVEVSGHDPINILIGIDETLRTSAESSRLHFVQTTSIYMLENDMNNQHFNHSMPAAGVQHYIRHSWFSCYY